MIAPDKTIVSIGEKKTIEEIFHLMKWCINNGQGSTNDYKIVEVEI